MKARIENWLGHEIRFVEKSPGDWWAVAADIANAMGYKHTPHMLRSIVVGHKDVHKVDTPGGIQEMSIVSELGIYAIIMRARRKEAEQFQVWVYTILRQLRQLTGLEAFQVFRLLDKEHQRAAMANLCKTIKEPVRVDFIKANNIANKAVSTKFGFSKMVKKGNMSPEMLIERQPILDDTVELMGIRDRFGLGFSVSNTIYEKYAH